MPKELVPTRTALLTRIRSEPQTNRNETNFTLLLYEATLIYTNRKILELSPNLPLDLQVQIHRIHSLIDFAPVVLDDQLVFFSGPPSWSHVLPAPQRRRLVDRSNLEHRSLLNGYFGVYPLVN